MDRIIFKGRVLGVALALLACDAGIAATRLRADRHERVEGVRTWTAPPVDVEYLRLEDEANALDPEIPFRIALAMPVSISPRGAGDWDDPEPGTRRWRLRLHSPEALWLALGFDAFRLPPGAELRILDGRGDETLAFYRSTDVQDHGELWTPPFAGEALLLELRWPAGQLFDEQALHLSRFGHGYKPLDAAAPRAPRGNEECAVGINCALGADWQAEKRGVVRLMFGIQNLCSATLLNTPCGRCRPVLLTARHCISSQATANSVQALFQYEAPECGGTPDPGVNLGGGATLLATHVATDFTLLELNVDPPPATHHPYFNGWNRNTTASTEAWGIHHPETAAKEICFSDDTLQDSPFLGATHWYVNGWEEGRTRDGSSGSALFDANHRVIGQLDEGSPTCLIGYDDYGKLAVSWEGGGTPASRLRDWLDPNGTSVLTVDGLDAASCPTVDVDLTQLGLIIDDSNGGNGNGVLEPGETATLELTLDNFGTRPVSGIAAGLTTQTPGVTLLDDAAEVEDIPCRLGSTVAPHFQVQVDPDVACGSELAFQLDMTGTSPREGAGAWQDEFVVPTGPECSCVDVDADGFGAAGGADCDAGPLLDCNDGLASVFPGAVDVCENQVDEDCDGVDRACMSDDLIFDFGSGTGVYRYDNDASWSFLTGLEPVRWITGDVDGSGQDDVVVDFGPGIGVYVYTDGQIWSFLTGLTPVGWTVGDLDGTAADDLVIDFGPGVGIYSLADGTTWTFLTGLPSEQMAAARLDGNARDDVVFDFGPGVGIWWIADGGSWTFLTGLDAEAIVAADLDGSGQDDVVFDFGSGTGVYVFDNFGTWTLLTTASPEAMLAVRLDGNLTADLVLDRGPDGVDALLNGTTWSTLTGLDPLSMIRGDVDGNDLDDLIFDFGPGIGAYVYRNGSAWSFLTGLAITAMESGELDGQ